MERRNDCFAVHKKIKEVVGSNRNSNTRAILDDNIIVKQL